MHVSMKCWLVFSFPQWTKASMYNSHYTKTFLKYFIMIFSAQCSCLLMQRCIDSLSVHGRCFESHYTWSKFNTVDDFQPFASLNVLVLVYRYDSLWVRRLTPVLRGYHLLFKFCESQLKCSNSSETQVRIEWRLWPSLTSIAHFERKQNSSGKHLL